MSHAHKNLNQYFDAAKAQEPLVPFSDLQEMITQLPSSTPRPGKTSAAAGNKTIRWTLGGMSTLVIALLLWMGLEENAPKTAPAQITATASSRNPRAGEKETNPPSHTPASAPAQDNSTSSSTPAIALKEPSSRNAVPRQKEATSSRGATPPGPTVTSSQAGKAKEGEKVFGKITLVELPRETEEKLGIQTDDRGILYERILHDRVEGAVRLQFSIYGGNHSVFIGSPAVVQIGDEFPFKFGTDSSKLLVPVTTFFPVYISNRQGERRVMYSTDGEDQRKFEPEYFNEIVNTLLPVLVRANNKTQDEAIFWFAATPDFLSFLPQPLHQEIAQEYRQRTQHKKSATDSSGTPASRRTGTQLKYFESGPGSLSSVQYAVVFPNPTADVLNLSMSLKREEEMRVRLVDINGKLVKELSSFKRYPAGAVTEKFSVKGTPRGLYLLLAQTKSGHQHTQRIIIE